MKVYKLKDMTGGWFVGAFKPAALVTKKCEVAFKQHQAGEDWPEHYQKEAIEINLLLNGDMRVCGKRLHSGDIFAIDPMEKSKPFFYSNCDLVVVKIPSIPKDKMVV